MLGLYQLPQAVYLRSPPSSPAPHSGSGFFLMRFSHQTMIFCLLASSYLSCLLTYVMGIGFGHWTLRHLQSGRAQSFMLTCTQRLEEENISPGASCPRQRCGLGRCSRWAGTSRTSTAPPGTTAGTSTRRLRVSYQLVFPPGSGENRASSSHC